MSRLSVIIPARNEEAQIGRTVEAVLRSAAALEGQPLEGFHLDGRDVEVLLVDNLSTDSTIAAVEPLVERHGLRVLSCPKLKAPCARNFGAARSSGEILVFVDADTWVPPLALGRVLDQVERCGKEAGICRLASQEPGLRARAWWAFWGFARTLPLARAKAMPAFMFCTRQVFDRFGPFDEEVVIGEEWPILADLWRTHPEAFVFDRTLTALSSSRRMDLQPFGYSRTFAKYVWAVLHQKGRLRYADTIRQSEVGGS